MNRRKVTRQIDVSKASLYAIIVNISEIAVLMGFVVYLLFTGITPQNRQFILLFAVIGGLMASWGAFLDIREALMARRRQLQIMDLEQTNTQMDDLNHTLRAQRHDFLNHLQVVYSLMEMSEYAEATDYLEKVYGDIRAVSSFLSTRSTAVNALLKVKAGACAHEHISLQMDIKSPLQDLPMPAWELCRVLGNLIDNAMDAARQAEHPQISLSIAEDIRAFRFTIDNNGAVIPEELLSTIFEEGVSTKGENHGMGLSIVKNTLKPYGGTVDCLSGESGTRFSVLLPKIALKDDIAPSIDVAIS
ncbi:MAG TPA: Spo0B domain-containing protein [Candidatus Limiplasma sp.]|nr:Spo0B domain-containing protein [Candidatus Limiplasma sp.]HRX07992.1 Spo0B domain-containing protein [Candidatus Limiplasma sp.]